jgi:hypothetical protein
MGADNEQSDFTMSRRRLVTALGLGSGALAAATLNIAPDARAAILADSSPASAGAPPVAGLHLQFGADVSTEITVTCIRRSLSPIHASRLAASIGG